MKGNERERVKIITNEKHNKFKDDIRSLDGLKTKK